MSRWIKRRVLAVKLLLRFWREVRDSIEVVDRIGFGEAKFGCVTLVLDEGGATVYSLDVRASRERSATPEGGPRA